MHLCPTSPDTSKHPNETPTARRRRRSTSGNTSPVHGNRNKTGNRCSNCNTDNTPLWRKGADGNTLCNKCGVYWKRHNKDRPIIDRQDNDEHDEEEHTSATTRRPSVHEEEPLIKPTASLRSPSRKRSLTVKIKLAEPAEEGQVEEEDVQCKKKKRTEVPEVLKTEPKETVTTQKPEEEEEQQGQTAVFNEVTLKDVVEQKPTDMQLEPKTPPAVDFQQEEKHQVEPTVTESDQYPEKIKSLQQQLAAFAIEQQELAGHSTESLNHHFKCDCDRLGYICNDSLMYCCDPYSQIFLELSPV
ncbi:GATA-binding factor [Acrasis kona]|uniref:GATA-binding factor n=1 Tax=Acrasis kona TaxID=1008807 RepID=A0AAW2YUY1_9EUKA